MIQGGSMTKLEKLSRRRLLRVTVRAIGTAAAIRLVPHAAAEEELNEENKIKRTEAEYRPQRKGQQRCEICLQFESPDKCKIVQGPISPTGWCQYFAARENAH
jgi:hypothetical protein